MAFTTQALASVAYQVGNLAGHTLRMLDLQGAALRQVEAKMSTLGQVRMWKGISFHPHSSVHSNSLYDKIPFIFSLSTWSTELQKVWHVLNCGDFYHGYVLVDSCYPIKTQSSLKVDLSLSLSLNGMLDV